MPCKERIADVWGTRPYGPGEPWPVRLDTFLAGGLTADEARR